MGENKFPQIIKELRKNKNLTQQDLANIVGITSTGVFYWESGAAMPNIETLNRLSKYFGVTIDYLLGNEELDKYKKDETSRPAILFRKVEQVEAKDKETLYNLLENTIDIFLKPRFSFARNKADEVLLLQENLEIPVIAKKLKIKDREVLIFSYKDYAEKTSINELSISGISEDAFTQINVKPNTDLILYNSEITSNARINWSIAHELGHIVLGHREQKDIYEVEANTFASQLLLPQCVLKYLLKNSTKVTVDYLVTKFGLSKEASNKYLVNMRSNIDKEYISEFDDIILNKFLPYIQNDCDNDDYLEQENNRNNWN